MKFNPKAKKFDWKKSKLFQLEAKITPVQTQIAAYSTGLMFQPQIASSAFYDLQAYPQSYNDSVTERWEMSKWMRDREVEDDA